ncbi:YczE/YyaS/YitT family protein [Bacillus sp. Marseille-P3661]|uniref:YczE/YyaS/YitT family protein n=1 Tax=Bacillus sp. Marseille-P3661 TaxID=1936234 RepID=UPI000C819323|nr:hypothetical protein [Bacillus sp. Marseille-P3661]
MKDVGVKLFFYLMGIVCLTFGISCSINSQLGASPLPALQVGLQQTIGLTVGSWEFIIGVIFVVIISAVRRKKPDILAFLTSFLIGLGIDLWLFLTKLVDIPDLLVVKIILICLGLIFIGVGVSMYLQPKFSPAPPDGIQILIEEYFKIKLSTARTLFAVAVAVGALVFNGPIGIGTLIMVSTSGPIIGFMYPIAQRYYEQLNNKVLIGIIQQETQNESMH